MTTLTVPLALVLAGLLFVESPAQTKRDGGATGTEKREKLKAHSGTKDRETERKPPPPPIDVPQTKPIDLVWPPGIVSPPYAAVPPPVYVHVPPPEEGIPQRRAHRRPGKVVQLELGDCVENPARAGYNFREERVVSCEDSTVDIYLSYTEKEGYFFLVPDDTDVKDIGPYGSVAEVRRFAPKDWAYDHAIPLAAGHVYVVWTHVGDFFLVQVRDLQEKHALIEWRWHSNLSRSRAVERDRQSVEPTDEESYFGK